MKFYFPFPRGRSSEKTGLADSALAASLCSDLAQNSSGPDEMHAFLIKVALSDCSHQNQASLRSQLRVGRPGVAPPFPAQAETWAGGKVSESGVRGCRVGRESFRRSWNPLLSGSEQTEMQP